MDDTTETVESPTAAAGSFEEHRALRTKSPDPAAAKVEKPPQESAPPVKGSESAAGTEPAKTQESEKPKPHKASAEDRINDLTAKWRDEERKRQQIERELAELKTKPAAETKPAADTKPPAGETKPKAGDDTEPDPDKFETYDGYIRALSRWEARQERKQELEQEGRARRAIDAEKQKTAFLDKIATTRSKRADFDTLIQAGIEATANVKNVGIEAAVNQSEDPGELLYALASNLEEYRRIAALGPEAAYREILRLELKMLTVATPEKKEPPPVSKAPKPPAPVGGGEAPPVNDTSKAGSFAEHVRLRTARRA